MTKIMNCEYASLSKDTMEICDPLCGFGEKLYRNPGNMLKEIGVILEI